MRHERDDAKDGVLLFGHTHTDLVVPRAHARVCHHVQERKVLARVVVQQELDGRNLQQSDGGGGEEAG